MATEEISVRGLTGIDMRLAVAGVGTRAYAFVIDWHIRVLLALAWLLLGMLIGRAAFGRFDPPSQPLFALAVFAPPVLVYFLYHPVLEVLMRGRTPGKRMAKARIVTREGAIPGTGALLMRNLFRLIDSLPLFYVVGLVCCIFMEQHVRIGDLAAGTVLVVDESRSKSNSLERVGALLQHSSLDPRAAALIEEVLDRWQELEPQRRAALARDLLRKVDAESPADQLVALDDAALCTRLRGLIGRT